MDGLQRLAMISLHTSPLDQPGTGDAGGMNVYVIELAKRLVRRGVEVDIFTRATSSTLDQVVEACDGVTVRHIHAGPFEGLTKNELPAQLCVFAREVLRTEAAQPVGHYDVVHSHYWLSGQVGALARDRWGVPLVHSMHTMAKVKNDALAEGDTPEPLARVIGEEQVVEAADMLIASTDLEAKQLIELYDADPARVEVVHPGVDLDVFRPVPKAGGPRGARAARGRRRPALRRPDPAAQGARRAAPRGGRAARARAGPPLAGSWSRSSAARPAPGSTSRRRSPTWRRELGLTDVVRFVPPVSQAELAQWYAAATLVAVPSYNESFGLVAVEAEATGTPVVAAAVGGLTTVVRDGHSGLLVPGHHTDDWADALHRVLADDELRARLEAGARRAGRAVLVGRHRRGDARASTSAPAPRSRQRGVTRPGRAAPRLPRGQRPRLRRAAARPVLVRPARREEAADPGPARRRHPRARRARLRLPPSRREPRAGLRVAAAAQPASCTASRSPSTGSATSTSTGGCRSSVLDDDDELDRLLGAVLTTADESFNTILELGFASSIRKEWEWRKLRGESTENLEAFRGWLEVDESRTAQEAARTSTNPTSAGSACTTRIRRLTVTAPYAPATMTQARKKSFTSSRSSTSPHTRPAARNPL